MQEDRAHTDTARRIHLLSVKSPLYILSFIKGLYLSCTFLIN